MTHTTLIKIIDLFSFIALTIMVSTGLLVKYTLPPRSGGNEVWGITRHEWGNIHYYISVIFLILITSHLITHYKFIKMVLTGNATTEKNYRIAFGILGIIALLFLVFSPVISPVTENQSGQQHYYKNR